MIIGTCKVPVLSTVIKLRQGVKRKQPTNPSAYQQEKKESN